MHDMNMTIVGQDVLSRVARRNAPLRNWLEAWVAAVEHLDWLSINDVRQAYPTADGVKLRDNVVVTIFNVKGNEYRMLTLIDYEVGVIEVLDVLTHAEYDKARWKSRYQR